jgi:hypothetical protein
VSLSQAVPTRETDGGSANLALITLAVLLVGIYAALAAISFQFGPDSKPVERPVLLAVGLLGIAFLGYALSIRIAVRWRPGKRLLPIVLVASLLMRVVSLFSWPILEIDIYRYIWDGATALQQVSPYRYSPEQVLESRADTSVPEDMRRLVALRDGNPALGTILSRVHYGELPTIYPPVSQAVFAVAVALTPSGADVFTYLTVMKSVLVLFDMATVIVVFGLLKISKSHIGWAIAYGWCPLVIKEVANTGHLDSIAVFLTTLALYLAVRPLESGAKRRSARVQTVLSSVVLALAVAAKLYPVVLVPMLVWTWSRAQGWRWATFSSAVFASISTAILWPMIPLQKAVEPVVVVDSPITEALPPPPVDTSVIVPQDPSGGLRAFLQRWEINDFLFLLVVENLRPSAELKSGQHPWFSVVAEPWKQRLVSCFSGWPATEHGRAAFLLARLLTGALFTVIALVLVWRARRSTEPADWLRVAFLTLAWFWLLSPTQNPWYWLWALPLVPFARSRAWLAVSGLAFIYYLRFWLIYHWPEQPLLGTPYSGAAFFDFVVTWIEFGPWFLWLAIESLSRRYRRQL